MKPARIAALAALAALAVPAHADLFVIANTTVAVAPDDVRDIFLGDKQVAGGTKLVPVDNAPQQKEFLEKVLHVDAAKYNTIWVKKGFRDGLNAPAVKAGDAEVIAAVKATPGGIGYVSAPPKDLKVIAKY
jgi:hypothetical protein